jgi:CMP-N-acetylneuraminic acid synthetase
MSVLAIVPARGGSKRLPRKNLMKLDGKPLLQWTLESARDSGIIDTIVVSTEDEEIATLSKKLGYDGVINRPVELASDGATTESVLIHAMMNSAPHDYMACLQLTSPLRTGDDIFAVYQTMLTSGADSAVTVCNPGASLNGAVYMTKWDIFIQNASFYVGDCRAVAMDESRSYDIDTEEDAEAIMSEIRKRSYRRGEHDGRI